MGTYGLSQGSQTIVICLERHFTLTLFSFTLKDVIDFLCNMIVKCLFPRGFSSYILHVDTLSSTVDPAHWCGTPYLPLMGSSSSTLYELESGSISITFVER
jgi:hypothetical protein